MGLLNRLLPTLILLTVILCIITLPVAALSELAGKGLDLAAEIAKGQDAVAGVEKYAKDKYSDWLWEAAGGYEKLRSGNLIGESYIEQTKGKFDTIQTVINAISDFALAIDAGKYDEALYHTIDTAVSSVDHPLVTATWEAAKLTYQSHQMVKNTEAARQIEVLFAELHHDRRLFSNEDGNMKQIPMNSDTVDYFFNDYVVTDAAMRERVKDYVKVRLNEEWPEESWGSWLKNLRLIGSGIDIEEAEETEILTGEYKNQVRGWIRSLMEDVNIEAQRWYHEMQLRKLMTEFQAFRQELNSFDADIYEILNVFLRIKEIKAKEDFYRNFLAESEKKYQQINERLVKTDGKRRSLYSSLYNEARKWQIDCVSYMSQIRYAGMKSLADSYLKQYREWLDLLEKIHDNIPAIVTDPGEAYYETYPKAEEKPMDWKIINTLTSGLLKEPDFIKNKSYVESLKSEFLELVTDTSDTSYYRYTGGSQIYPYTDTLLDIYGLDNLVNYEWQRYYNQCNSELKRISSASNKRYKLYVKMLEGGSSEDISSNREALQQIEAAVNKKVAEREASHSEGHYVPLFYDDQGNELSSPDPEKLFAFKTGLVKNAVKQAEEIVSETVVAPASIYLRESNNWFRDRQKIIQQRIGIRREQYEEIIAYLEDIRLIHYLTNDVYVSTGDLSLNKTVKLLTRLSSGSPVYWLEDFEMSEREDSFEGYWGIPYKKIYISNYLMRDAKTMSGIEKSIVSDKEYFVERQEIYLNDKSRIEKIKKIWNKITVPTAEEAEEIKELVDKDFSRQALLNLGVEIERQYGESKEIISRLERIESLFEEDYMKRMKEAERLKDTAFRMNILFDNMETEGLIKPDFEDVFQINLPEGNAYVTAGRSYGKENNLNGMILTAEPYPHLMKEDEIKALQEEMSVIRDKFTQSDLYNFYSNYAPEAFKILNDILVLKRISDGGHNPIKVAPENIILHPIYMDQGKPAEIVKTKARRGEFAVIKESNLTEAEEILKKTAEIVEGEVDENYRLINEGEFIANIKRISELLPLTAEVRSSPAAKDVSVGGRVTINESGEKVFQEIKYLIKEEALDYLVNYSLAERYKQFALDLRDVFYKYHHRAEEESRKEEERLILFEKLAEEIKGVIDTVEFSIYDEDYENALLYEQDLQKFKTEFKDLPGEDPGSRVPELLNKLEELFTEIENLKDKDEENFNKIKNFYEEFVRRYELKDEFGVLALLADEWEAADGTTLWDLEDTLSRNFRVFDEVSYQISNLEISESDKKNRYLVYYDLKIVSMIYDRDITHEELSSVREVLELNEDGSFKIIKTLGGRFWKE